MIGVTSDPITRLRWRRNRTNSRRQSDNAGRHQFGAAAAGGPDTINGLDNVVVVMRLAE